MPDTTPARIITDPSAPTTEAIRHEVSVISHDLQVMQEAIHSDLANRQETRQRELTFQRDLFDTKVKGLQDSFDIKINSINEATFLRLDAMRRIPADIKDGIDHHESLQLERFKSINQQFVERDIRTDQASRASSEALAAALQAAKELVGAQGEASAAAAVKSETSFTKQIDQIGTIIQTLEKALDARITELKERIDRGEGTNQGIASNKAGMVALAGFILTTMLIINFLGASGVLGGN